MFRSPGPRNPAPAKPGEGGCGTRRRPGTGRGDCLRGRNSGWVQGRTMAPTLAPKRVRRLGLWLPLASSRSRRPCFPLGLPAASSKCRQKAQGQKEKRKEKKEKHEGKKNGCRGLRIPKPLGPFCLFCGPERHTTADFSFPYRLPPAADTSAWISGSSGCRTLREKPAKQDQTWRGGGAAGGG